jgi:hypothetical protein
MQPKDRVECRNWHVRHMFETATLVSWWHVRIIKIHVLPARHVLKVVSMVIFNSMDGVHVTHMNDIVNILQGKELFVVGVYGFIVPGGRKIHVFGEIVGVQHASHSVRKNAAAHAVPFRVRQSAITCPPSC